MSQNNTITLNSGHEMPLLGLGTWQSPKGQVFEATYDAIKAGYRHIDCAYVYGNEQEVGDAISKAINEKLIKREDLFLTSKCWLTFYSRERVSLCLERTLQRLKLDYLDLYLIHWPIGFKDHDTELFPKESNGKILENLESDFTNTWQGMEDVQKKGFVRSIGVSNFNSKQIERILKMATIKPAMNQIECHPLLTQKELIKDMQEKGIAITAYCPLGSSPARDGSIRPSLRQNEIVEKIAKKHGKQAAQVLIRFHVQRGIVCIPKSVTKERIEANSQVFDFELSGQELDELDSLNTGYRFCSSSFNGLDSHRDTPF